jgi:CopG family nickel-responsive transcriptional regulator
MENGYARVEQNRRFARRRFVEGIRSAHRQTRYANRLEAFRDLIRKALLSEMVESNKPVVGTLTIVYDHHVPNLAQKLTEVQHVAGTMVLAATHIHLDHHYCLEVIIMKGRGKDIQAVADGMLALRGVELGKLVLTNSGASLKQATHNH